jgi:hypothetical protein
VDARRHPYVVGGSVSVAAGRTLIEPGVVVKLNGQFGTLWVNGSLSAVGTVDERIVFTSIQDDSVAGEHRRQPHGRRPEPVVHEPSWAGAPASSSTPTSTTGAKGRADRRDGVPVGSATTTMLHLGYWSVILLGKSPPNGPVNYATLVLPGSDPPLKCAADYVLHVPHSDSPFVHG